MTIQELVNKCNKGEITSDISMQREIVYDANKQELVIDSVLKGIPLPAIYLWQKDDNNYEVLDGKQRIESFKRFLNNEIKYNGLSYYDLGQSEQGKQTQKQFENTSLTIIYCKGSEELKREIFYRINAFGVPLNDYEIINGLVNNTYIKELNEYCTTKLVKTLFDKPNSRGAYEYFFMKFLSNLNTSTDIALWLSQKQHFNKDAKHLNDIVRFINDIFIKIKSKYQDLNVLFKLANKYLDKKSILMDFNVAIKNQIVEFYKDPFNKKIYNVFTFLDDLLNSYLDNKDLDPKRLFSLKEKETLFESSCYDETNLGKVSNCANCNCAFKINNLVVDHIIPWSKGGKTSLENAQLLCVKCNSIKSNK